ncbi:MAG TPA: ABC transporter permease subunit [Solirubrobacteraceae bacterium]|nr:ABC transporter permease subunit [Solirubrobacteraceae bacterium]
MSGFPLTVGHRGRYGARPRGSSLRSWRWSDRVVYVLAWASGVMLCAVAGALVAYLAVRGVQYLSPSVLFSRPQPGLDQARTGGFLDPILGTLLITLIGVVLATPIAVASAVWVVEYGRPTWLARVVESSVEIVAGTPDIVIAIFGLALFQLGLFAPLSFTSAQGGVFGRSFLVAGAMMSLLALPSVFTAVRDGLEAIPGHQREGAFALGKTRVATIRRVLLPGVRPNIATGVTLGIGRIVGDTAIVLVLLGASLRLDPQSDVPGVGLLRGTGSTLTSYVYDNSPAGEGNAPQKAYAAAFVLLLLVLGLNSAVGAMSRRGAHAPVGRVGLGR